MEFAALFLAITIVMLAARLGLAALKAAFAWPLTRYSLWQICYRASGLSHKIS